MRFMFCLTCDVFVCFNVCGVFELLNPVCLFYLGVACFVRVECVWDVVIFVYFVMREDSSVCV